MSEVSQHWDALQTYLEELLHGLNALQKRDSYYWGQIYIVESILEKMLTLETKSE